MAGKTQTALVIWLHGLGDSGQGWSDLSQQLGRRMPWVKWHFPDAPIRPITCNDGDRMRGWFDLADIPVQHGQAHPGLIESVAAVHAMLAQAQSAGFPAHRVVVGGFSQGGALSLHAGLTAPAPLAGVCCLSGWAADGLPAHLPWPHVPVLVAHGTADTVVPFAAGRAAAELLQQRGATSLTFQKYQNLPHSSSPDEMQDVADFLLAALPALPVARAPELVTAVPMGVPLGASVQAAMVSPSGAQPGAQPAVPLQVRAWVQDHICRVEILAESTDGLALDVSDTTIKLVGRTNLSINWPQAVDASRARAQFLRRGLLVLQAPVR